MATVRELSDPYTNFLLNPLSPTAQNVCSDCLTFTRGYPRCYRCENCPRHVDAVLPVSYSVHFGQLHTALRGYKRQTGAVAERFGLELAAVLWRFLSSHEGCLAERAGTDAFSLVTTVPSSSAERDGAHPLHSIVGLIVGVTRRRYERLLGPSGHAAHGRAVDVHRYRAVRPLTEEPSVLLLDDTWTTGASVQSAAGALKAAGARRVGAVVIGRHVHEDYQDNGDRLREVVRPFQWDRCAFE